MTQFIVVRHGYSKNNKEKRFTGQSDVPLDEIGVKQAELTSKYISENFKVARIYSSDLSRAYNTAKPLADILSLPVITCPQLRELNVGHWQGMLIEDVKKLYHDEYILTYEHPELAKFSDGESYTDIMERAEKIFKKIADENDGKTVVIATHGGFIRALSCVLKNIPVERIRSDGLNVSNASLTIINYDKGNAEFITAGDTKHLNDLAI